MDGPTSLTFSTCGIILFFICIAESSAFNNLKVDICLRPVNFSGDESSASSKIYDLAKGYRIFFPYCERSLLVEIRGAIILMPPLLVTGCAPARKLML